MAADLPTIPRSVAGKLGHYVYVYVDPRDESVFYVGKGQGKRALAHLGPDAKRKVTRVVRGIRARGDEPRVDILAHSLRSADAALAVEAAAIDLLQVRNLANSVRGHGVKFGRAPVKDLVARYTRRKARVREPVLVIRLGDRFRPGMSAQELYDLTRSAWVLGRDREKAKYVLAVCDGVVREAYAVAHWLPAVSTFNGRWDGRARRRSGRWEFVGTIAPGELRKRYVDRYVGHYFRKGNANPVMYLNVAE